MRRVRQVGMSFRVWTLRSTRKPIVSNIDSEVHIPPPPARLESSSFYETDQKKDKNHFSFSDKRKGIFTYAIQVSAVDLVARRVFFWVCIDPRHLSFYCVGTVPRYTRSQATCEV